MRPAQETVKTSKLHGGRVDPSRANHQIKASRLGKCPEVAVTRQEGDSAIKAALGDQGIAEAGLPAPGEHTGS